jgi:uncharacterized protein YecE (DUF72 family)
MPSKTLYGCAGIRGPIALYARRNGVLELDVLDRSPAPKASAFKKWRKDAGPRLAFSLVAPRAVAAVKPSAALDAGLEVLLEAQRASQAKFVLLATPVEVTPAHLPRERFGKLVDRIREGLGDARAAVRIVWQPRGVWELEEAARFAKTLDVDLAGDPLADPREPFWDDALRYLRLSAIGGRTAFPPTRLRAIAELLAAVQKDDADAGQSIERVVVFTTPSAPAEAKRLRALVDQIGERGASKGGGRVISPRAGRALRDEEE